MRKTKKLDKATIKKLKEGYDYNDPWIITPSFHSDLSLFHDYLESMEAFIENEIQKRSGEFETIKEKLNSGEIPIIDPDQIPPEWYFADYYVKQAKDFANILRNSFFVNLYVFVESFLVKKYRQCFPGNPPPTQSIIKETTKKLIQPHNLGEIPQWEEVQYHILIRNCIVHNSGVLTRKSEVPSLNKGDRKKYEKIKKYIGNTPSLSIREEPVFEDHDYSKPPISADEKVIFQNGFCEDTLETMRKFLYSVEVISETLER